MKTILLNPQGILQATAGERVCGKITSTYKGTLTKRTTLQKLEIATLDQTTNAINILSSPTPPHPLGLGPAVQRYTKTFTINSNGITPQSEVHLQFLLVRS